VINRYIYEHNIPLDTEALATCQHALDAALIRLKIKREHEAADDIAALIIKCYQEGTHDEQQLFALAVAAGDNLKH